MTLDEAVERLMAEEHGDDHHDDDCEICVVLARIERDAADLEFGGDEEREAARLALQLLSPGDAWRGEDNGGGNAR